MKKTFCFGMIALLTLTATLAVGASSGKKLKKHHEGLACADCHTEKTPVRSTQVKCSRCHGSPEDVARLTEGKYKKHYNPHDPLHYGTHALCENCHREHTASVLECNNPNCHGEFKYKTP